MSNDGGSEFVADETKDFLQRWGVSIRQSAAYNPQSNGRAELAVKSTKRLIEDNVGTDGQLDTERFLRALLIKRNTPDPSTKLSPAEIVFGRKLRDTMPRLDKTVNVFFNKNIRPTWTDAWEKKELAMRVRYQGCQKRLAEHSKALPKLEVGDSVSIQNQTGKRPTKWDRSGTVVEIRDFDKYIVKVDGSGRLTLRNRRYLRKLFEDPNLNGPSVQKRVHPMRRVDDPNPSHEEPRVDGVPARTAPNNTLAVPEQLARHPNILGPEEGRPPTPNDTHNSSNNGDRPRRTISRRLMYDANKGTYAPCNPGDILDA